MNFWERVKYNRRADRPRRDEDPDPVNIQSCSAAVQNQCLAYTIMLRVLFPIAQHLFTWCEVCKCHTPPRSFAGVDLRALMPDLLGFAACRLRGRRAAELACGALHTFLRRSAI